MTAPITPRMRRESRVASSPPSSPKERRWRSAEGVSAVASNSPTIDINRDLPKRPRREPVRPKLSRLSASERHSSRRQHSKEDPDGCKTPAAPRRSTVSPRKLNRRTTGSVRLITRTMDAPDDHEPQRAAPQRRGSQDDLDIIKSSPVMARKLPARTPSKDDLFALRGSQLQGAARRRLKLNQQSSGRYLKKLSSFDAFVVERKTT